MKFSALLIYSSLLLASTNALSDVANGVNSNADLNSGSDTGVSPDINAEVKEDYSKLSSKLNVHKLENEDNDPTPSHAKKPLDPYANPEAKQEEGTKDIESSYDSFVMSVSMIIVSEIGDKTFLIAALMAMRNSRFIVFSSAFSSLAVMTVLSGVVGHALPTLISQRLTQFLASVLFVVFGIKLLNEGLSMSKDLGVDEELAEVEEELASSNINEQLNDIESGNPSDSTFKPKPTNRKWHEDMLDSFQNLASFVLSPVWIQVFVMTFLGEWGDRSQIATIAMAAGSDYWMVILGAIIGHGFCTAAACIGGKLLAKRISMRNVTLGGAIAFFVFAILYFYDAYNNTGATE